MWLTDEISCSLNKVYLFSEKSLKTYWTPKVDKLSNKDVDDLRNCMNQVWAKLIDDEISLKLVSIAELDHAFRAPPVQMPLMPHAWSLLSFEDKNEKRIPSLGLIEIENNESNIKKWVNTSSSDFNQIKEKTFKYKENELQKFLKKINTNYLKISSDSDYVKDLIKLFKFRNNN